MRSHFTLTSPEPVAAVRARLAAALTVTFSFFPNGRPTFRGRVADEGFEITRNRAWMGRSIPIRAAGRFEPIPGGGTLIRINTRPGFWVIVAAGWMLFVVGQAARHVYLDRYDLRGFAWMLFFGLVAFVWLTWLCWMIEERVYRDELARILAAPGAPPAAVQ